MLQSMTGFAGGKGEAAGYNWAWELRSVNSKGLDLRFRVPDWIEGLDQKLRPMIVKSLARGSVTLSLRVQRIEEGTSLSLNHTTLDLVLTALAEVEQKALDQGHTLSPSNATDVLAVRGVLEASNSEGDTEALATALVAAFPELLKDFVAMRQGEGAALEALLKTQIDEIAKLTESAGEIAEKRRAEVAETLRANLRKVLENTDGVEEGRIAQELALLAVKSDVTEEIDRLRAHVDAARSLVSQGSPIGRKLDFLMQEFNREANTLCSKAQNVDLTRVGLDLKAVIDQMREQVQNVE
ncbi:YicC/YloC family endoribonuclease [Cognatishimia maritima]|uniref:TIGR00255 family protein n=1 Tax=Cognatishimia maritima TaxID=870908 RepID=A0A1M5IRW4_9RHOB|nr:YicC/YloC family endoribonuclease [Cognatishimia maritima]SHG31001.1 TIGR00255 family protein [Cognatishimia maritima]